MIRNAHNGMSTNIHNDGLTKPISQELLYQSSTNDHQAVITSRPHTHTPLGIPRSSVKKINDESKRNIVSTGLKTKFATGVSNEIGKPHTIRIGNEINERNSCNSTK
jgi:hypothetical protein